MEKLAMIFVLAFLIETLVEAIFGPVFANSPKLARYKWVQMYIAMVAGVIGAFAFGFNILGLVGQQLNVPIAVTPLAMAFGITITGLAIGRGSNYIHDLVSKLLVKPEVGNG